MRWVGDGKNRCGSPVQLASGMADFAEERLAELIALLPPSPEGWAEAAIELPSAGEAIDELVARAIADQRARQEILVDLEAALRAKGVEPRAQLVKTLRLRLSGLD
jgi:hypothetical protein